MNGIFSIGLSGMQAAQRRLDVSGHNVANAATQGFRRQQLVSQTDVAGGVSTQLRASAGYGEDLAADLIDQRLAQHLFTANLRTVQTADRLLGTLLDAKA